MITPSSTSDNYVFRGILHVNDANDVSDNLFNNEECEVR